MDAGRCHLHPHLQTHRHARPAGAPPTQTKGDPCLCCACSAIEGLYRVRRVVAPRPPKQKESPMQLRQRRPAAAAAAVATGTASSSSSTSSSSGSSKDGAHSLPMPLLVAAAAAVAVAVRHAVSLGSYSGEFGFG